MGSPPPATNSSQGGTLTLAVRLGLGVLLLVAGLLKLGSAPPVWFVVAIPAAHHAWVALFAAELLLGALLLCGWAFPVVRLCSVLFFVTGLGVSVLLGLNGAVSCGCFGRVEASPWLIAALDSVALALLALSYISQPTWPRRREVVALFAVVLFPIAGVAIGGTTTASEISTALRNESAMLAQPVARAEPAERWKSVEFEIGVANISAEPLRILGGQTNCSHHFKESFPIDVPAGETASLTLSVSLRDEPGPFARIYEIYYSDRQTRILRGRIAGRVLPRSAVEKKQ